MRSCTAHAAFASLVLLLASSLAPTPASGQLPVLGPGSLICVEGPNITCPGAPLTPGTSMTVYVDEITNNAQPIFVGLQQGSLLLCDVALVNGTCPDVNGTSALSDIIGFGRRLGDPPGQYFVRMLSNVEAGQSGGEPADTGFPARGIILFAQLEVQEPGVENSVEQLTYRAQNANGTIDYVITSDSVVVPEPSTMVLVGTGLVSVFGVIAGRRQLG